MIVFDFPWPYWSEPLRSVRTIKSFTRSNWEPIVLLLTEAHQKWGEQSIYSSIKDQFRFHTVEPKETDLAKFSRLKLIKKMRWSLLSFDYLAPWSISAINEGKNIIKNEKIDIVLSRSSPIGTHIIGGTLRTLSKVPWVADFSDPWMGNPLFPPSRKFVKTVDGIVEATTTSMADRLIFTTRYAREDFISRRRFQNEKRCKVIPNSFDPNELQGVKPIRTSEKFTITYSGTFYGERNPEAFLAAIKDLISEGMNLHVNFIGSDQSAEKTIESFGLSNVVNVYGFMNPQKLFSYLLGSDVLLLIDAPSEKPSLFMPLKLAEYVWMNKPILGLTPEGASADIIRETNTGVIVHPKDTQAIKHHIEDLYEQHRTKTYKIKPKGDKIERYSTKRCTEELISVFEELV